MMPLYEIKFANIAEGLHPNLNYGKDNLVILSI